MKKFKFFTSIMMSLIMVLTLCAGDFSVMADDETPTTYSITINPKDNADHTFKAYQVFTGDLSGTTLSNIQWGTGVNNTDNALLNAVKNIKLTGETESKFKDCADAAAVAKVLSDNNTNTALAQKFADVVAVNLGSVAASSNSKNANGKYVISGLSAGYYLITDKDSTFNNNNVGAYTDYILKVTDNVEVNAKADVPSIDKNIIENNTTTKANNASIGDKVNYQLDSKVPDTSAYNKYFYIINDRLSEGLTFNNDVTIKIGSTTLTANDFTVETSTDSTTKETIIKIVIKNFKQYTKDAAIEVKYSATLNEKANLVSTGTGAGNPNTVKLTFSNNPNVEYTGDTDNNKPDEPGTNDPMGETPESTVITYTTGIQINKVDGATKAALKGAKFTISGLSSDKVIVEKGTFTEDENGTYYKLKDGTYTETPATTGEGSNEALYESTTTKYKKTYTRTEETKGQTNVGIEAEVDADGILRFEGLGAGTYTITETVTPDGYNTIPDIKVEITGAKGTNGWDWTVKRDGSNVTDVENNLYKMTVENNKGATLPGTGGIGTKLFYIIGGMLVVAAGVLLITKRRMSTNK